MVQRIPAAHAEAGHGDSRNARAWRLPAAARSRRSRSRPASPTVRVAAGRASAAPHSATATIAVQGDGRVVSVRPERSTAARAVPPSYRLGARSCSWRCRRLAASSGAGRAAAKAGRAACELVIEGATPVTAAFAPGQELTDPQTLDVTRSAGGTVVSDPAGVIDCGSECRAGWTGGGQVTIRARADGRLPLRPAGSPTAAARTTPAGSTCPTTATRRRCFERDPIPGGLLRPDRPEPEPARERRRPRGRSGSRSGSTSPSARRTAPSTSCNGTHVILTPAGGTLRAWGGALRRHGRALPARGRLGNATVDASFRPGGPLPSFGVNVSRAGNGTITSTPIGIECGPRPAVRGRVQRPDEGAAAGGPVRPALDLRRLARGLQRPGGLLRGRRHDPLGRRGVPRCAGEPSASCPRGRGRGRVVSRPPGSRARRTAPSPSRATSTSRSPQPRPAAASSRAGPGACTGESLRRPARRDAHGRGGGARAASTGAPRSTSAASSSRQPRPRQLRVSLVLTGQAAVRLAVLRGRATVKGLRTGKLAPGTRTVVARAAAPRDRGAHAAGDGRRRLRPHEGALPCVQGCGERAGAAAASPSRLRAGGAATTRGPAQSSRRRCPRSSSRSGCSRGRSTCSTGWPATRTRARRYTWRRSRSRPSTRP